MALCGRIYVFAVLGRQVRVLCGGTFRGIAGSCFNVCFGVCFVAGLFLESCPVARVQ